MIKLYQALEGSSWRVKMVSHLFRGKSAQGRGIHGAVMGVTGVRGEGACREPQQPPERGIGFGQQHAGIVRFVIADLGKRMVNPRLLQETIPSCEGSFCLNIRA